MKSWVPTIVSCVGIIALSAWVTAFALSRDWPFATCFMLVGGTTTLGATFVLSVHGAWRRVR